MTTFNQRWTPPPKLRDLPPPDQPPAPALTRGSYASATLVAAPKAPAPVRDSAYRRLVASLPCFECCIVGFSQCAHPNTGKAKGKKQSDDLCFPLCCDRPGVKGCHSKFDQYELVPRGAMFEYETRALAWTLAALKQREEQTT